MKKYVKGHCQAFERYLKVSAFDGLKKAFILNHENTLPLNILLVTPLEAFKGPARLSKRLVKAFSNNYQALKLLTLYFPITLQLKNGSSYSFIIPSTWPGYVRAKT